ncbi:MAG: branched-chain amino acid ABC transporter permease [Bdellovibrionales bacterium]|nr:branched-chain amino acid ABC transporter permease [Bdellovibrionales bacterium]
MEGFIQHCINGLSLGSIYALIALGYTMVFGILKLINFAHGDVYMIGAFVGYYAARFFGLLHEPSISSFGIVLISSMFICAFLGFLIERIAYRPLRSAPRITSLITAIGISLFLEYCAQLIFGPDPKVFPQILNSVNLVQWGEVALNSYHVLIFSVSFILMVLLRFLVLKTKYGQAMRAVSEDVKVANLLGLPTNTIISLTFIMGAALAGAAGVLVGTVYPRIDPLMGIVPGIKAFSAAVIGGIGNFPGAVLGGLIMGLSEEMVAAYWSSSYRDAIAFAFLIIILLVKPSGFFGKYHPEKV